MSTRTTIPRLLQFSRSARFQFRRPVNRRFQSTEAPLAKPEQTLFVRLWNSPVGVKTVHFWAPVMKWALVIAGISDFSRPAEKLSLTQNLALTATGAIWTRWCFIIKPRNLLLAAVNFFLGCVGVVQVSRIFVYQRNLSNGNVSELVSEEGSEVEKTAKDVVAKVKKAATGA
ncbi:Mitochondrial pyruvate carrier 2 [Sticta canariensis]|nr:Mitochondrial pyruvate carrier 2 [Sticta canariensis]